MARFTDISTNLNTRNSDLVLSTDEDAINNSIDNIRDLQINSIVNTL